MTGTDVAEQVLAPEQGLNDPYNLNDYASGYVPPDGGKAPQPKTAEPPNYHDNRIYVSNIPFTFRDSDLIDLFNRFGSVHSAMIVCNERGSKGFGFVTMDSIGSCEKARHALHGTRILGRVIEVRKATPLAKPSRQHKRVPNTPTTPRAPPPAVSVTKTPRKPNPPAVLPPVVNTSTNLASLPMNQQAVISQFFADNPILLQNLLAPFNGGGFVHPPPQQQLPYYTQPPPTQLITAPVHQQQFMPCAVPPLQQGQTGFPYTISSLPTPQYHANNFGNDFSGQNIITRDFSPVPPPSLNNTMNQTLLSTSMSSHFMHLQDQMVNFLNLDATMNNSKFIEFKNGSLNSSVLLNGSSDLNDSAGRQRNVKFAWKEAKCEEQQEGEVVGHDEARQ